MMLDQSNFDAPKVTDDGSSAWTMRRWGVLASFLLAVAFFVAPAIYLFGDLRSTLGQYAYSLADTLYGPVWAASLITAFFALREYLGGHAPRRMTLALLAAVLAAGAMVLVACIRASNRHYHLIYPELHLENNQTVLIVWTTLVAGLSAAGWNFLGWALVLLSSAGWTSGHLPRLLCILYLSGGLASLFVYLFPELEGLAAFLGLIWAVWQGIILSKSRPEGTPAPERNVSQLPSP